MYGSGNLLRCCNVYINSNVFTIEHIRNSFKIYLKYFSLLKQYESFHNFWGRAVEQNGAYYIAGTPNLMIWAGHSTHFDTLNNELNINYLRTMSVIFFRVKQKNVWPHPVLSVWEPSASYSPEPRPSEKWRDEARRGTGHSQPYYPETGPTENTTKRGSLSTFGETVLSVISQIFAKNSLWLT